MVKFKALTKEVNLKEFRARSCTVCGNRVSVDSYNGKIHGRFGPSSGKILECDTCKLSYFYDWSYDKKKYVIGRAIFHAFGSSITTFIDYSGELRNNYNLPNTSSDNTLNVLITINDSNGFHKNHVYIGKTFSMPKRRFFENIREKAEIYAVFI